MTDVERDRPDRRREPDAPPDDPLEPNDPPTSPNDPTGKELTTPEDTLGG